MDTEDRSPSARYQTATPIGHGAMGRVYRAWDPEHERFVALKYLRSSDPEWVRRLRAEAAAQARLDHPNVAPVYGVGEDQGRVYIAMAYIDGRPFDEMLEELGLEGGVRILADCADAVQAAHAIGLVHRDLKPANILVSQDERGAYHPYVLDFGLVLSLDEETLTAPGEMLGTLGYMAPEQALGRRADVDRRADIYSLGCILYQVLAGAPPLAEGDRSEMLARLLNDDLPPPRNRNRRVPKALERICMQCLERDPGRRYASVAALRHDLECWLAGESVKARTTGPAWRLGRRMRRNPVMSALAGSALALVVAVAGWSVFEQHRLELRAAEAQRTGEALKDMEWRLRGAYMTPGADITWHKQDLRDGIDRLLTGFDRQGEVGSAQAAYVMGRAWLMLDQPQAALTQLEDERVRHHIPDADFWAGLALAQVYRQGLTEVSGIREPGLRAQRREALDRRFRDRALSLLGAPGGVAEHEVFRSALSAWLQNDLDRALNLARASREHRPWFFESRVLEADILHSRFLDALLSGDYRAAGDALKAVAESLARAVEIAPSAPHLLARGCETVRMRDELARLTRVDPSLGAEMDLSVCDRLVELEGDDALHQALLARAYTARRDLLEETGHAPPEMTERAVAAAHRALELDGDDPQVVHHCALALSELGWRMGRNADRGLALMSEALSLSIRRTEQLPGDGLAFSRAGTDARRLASLQRRRGSDSTDTLFEAVALLRRAVELQPEHPYPRHNLAYALKSLAADGDPARTDPGGLLSEALEQVRVAIEISGEAPVTVNLMGNIRSDLGQWRLREGLDPGDAFEQALQHYQRAAELNPSYARPHNNRANVARIMAGHLAESDQDPTEWLELGRQAARDALALNEHYALAWFNLGSLHLIEARYRAARALDATSAAQAAMAAYSRGLETTTTILGGWQEYAQAALMVAASKSADEHARGAAAAAVGRALEQMATLAPGHESIAPLRQELARLAPPADVQVTRAAH